MFGLLAEGIAAGVAIQRSGMDVARAVGSMEATREDEPRS